MPVPRPPSRRDFRRRRRDQEAAILDSLPEIAASGFTLTWELDPAARAWIIRHADRVIYREPAGQEGYHRFEFLARLLREKYGERVRDLVPVSTPEADFYLYGDYLGSAARVESARKRNFAAPSPRL
jgi:hypothetical protein